MALSARRKTRNHDDYGPKRFGSLADALANLRAPKGASYVVWNDTWPNDLEYVMANFLAADDILVLPERDTPYYINTANGFTYPTSTVTAWSDGALLVNNSRTWGEMVRSHRGILGLGPKAVIALKPSSFTQVAQGDDKTRYYINKTGAKVYEVGTFEKMIGCAHSQAYFGNFTIAPSLDFGGVAYNSIVWYPDNAVGTRGVFERIYSQGGHRGFSGGPNGETAALGILRGAYEIYQCEFDGRLPDGTAVGTSPVMINSSASGLIQDCYFHHARVGMPTLWNCNGVHTINYVRSEGNLSGPCWNLEKNVSGVTYNFNHCTMMLGSRKFQLNVGEYDSSAKINLRDVKFIPAQSYWPGYFSIQGYSNGTGYKQVLTDISVLDASGAKMPTRYSSNNVTTTL